MGEKFDRVAIALSPEGMEYVILDAPVLIDYGQGQGPRGGVVSLKDGRFSAQTQGAGEAVMSGGSVEQGGTFSANLTLRNADGQRRVVVEAYPGPTSPPGAATLYLVGEPPALRMTSSTATIDLDGGAGKVSIYDSKGRAVIRMEASGAAITVGAKENHGDISILDAQGRTRIEMRGDGGVIRVFGHDSGGGIALFDTRGVDVIHLDGIAGTIHVGGQGNGGRIQVRNAEGNTTIGVDGDIGDITLSNGDCAEEFDVVDPTLAEPGTVLVIDDEERLAPSGVAYDRRVAGVISGNGPCRPGIVLNRRREFVKRPAVALVGKVYCKVDASLSPVAAGDLLVTSPVVGHAMAGRDPARTSGAVLGKALRAMTSGRGLVPILVSLQ
jgi:hypothetical protein